MAGQEIEGEIIREVELKIDTRYASIRVLPKADEVGDANMPKHLHNAAELFLKVGMVENAQRVKETTDRLLNIYETNPDGKTNVLIGKGCVCWKCGHCGLSKNSERSKDDPKIPPGPCNNCGEMEQINFLDVTRKGMDGKVNSMPWIEAPPMSEEERKKKREAEISAKRAEVEARVKEALEERGKSE